MGASSGAAVLLAALAFCHASSAADCRIEKATYREAETGVELVFAAASGENTPVSHGFKTEIGKFKLDGHVMFDPEIERPIGMLMNNCPDGDVTGATIAACTVWKGIVYGIDEATMAVGGRGSASIAWVARKPAISVISFEAIRSGSAAIATRRRPVMKWVSTMVSWSWARWRRP